MVTEETEKLFSQLREAGYEPTICENDIPTFQNPVHCGPATEIGDVCSKDDEWYSRDIIERSQTFRISAIGNSMQDAGINAGDDLVIQKGITPTDGDILLVRLVDKFSVKAFYEDEDGQAWLVPYNDDYQPIKLGELNDYTVCGKVIEVRKKNPRVKSRDCMRRIRKMKEEKKREITPDRVESVIFDVSSMVKNGRQWYAVFRKLVELTNLGMAEMEPFCTLVTSIIPKHQFLPVASELQRMATQSFVRVSRLWDENDAPVTGKRFRDYQKIANRTEELLLAA
jgi:DNA polymerase V